MLASNIGASKTTVAVYDGFATPSTPLYTHFNQMRLAPNGKIYVSTDNGCDAMHVIEYPDSNGISCNVMQHFFYFSFPSSNVVSVPNIPNFKLGPLSESICDSLTSIPKYDGDEYKLSVYPNPSKGILMLKFNSPKVIDYSICVKDLAGRFLLQVKGNSVSGINLQEMNLNEFANGIYFMTLILGEVNETIRVIVE
jgi:hypothetical protein